MSSAPPRWALPPIRAFMTGVMFLTRLPCPRWVDHSPSWLARSTPYFPVIGWVVGVWCAGTYALVNLLWPPLIALLAALAAAVWLTGAFHEDGLADTFDGLGGGWTPDEMIGIMKDSRIGTYGTIAVVLVLAAKLAALLLIANEGLWAVGGAFVAGHVLGRWSSLPLIWKLQYVRHSESKSKPFAASVSVPRLAGGTLLAGGCMGGWWLATGLPFLALTVVSGTAVLVTLLGGVMLYRALGGITGDTLGAVNALTETAVYLALAALWT